MDREILPSGTPLDPAARMNIDISARKAGEKVLYTGPHLCVTCASENRIVSLYLQAGTRAPDCAHCGPRAVWEP